MDFDLDDDQRALQDGVRRFCAARFPMSVARAFGEPGGFDRTAWKDLAALGAFGIAVPTDAGGVGLRPIEAALVFDVLGAALVPGPLVACALAAPFVEGVLDGDTVATVVERAEPATVEHLRDADLLLVLDADGVWSVEPAAVDAWEVTPLDPTTPVAVAASLPKGTLVAGPDTAAAWRRFGSVLASAALVGISAAATDLGVAYAKQRHQFGRAIGSFQAIKHLLADSFARTEVARASVQSAAVTIGDPDVGDVERAVQGARVLAARAAAQNTRTCLQVHGGMGFTWEVDAHLYLKRAWVLEAAFGSVDDAAETVAERLRSAKMGV